MPHRRNVQNGNVALCKPTHTVPCLRIIYGTWFATCVLDILMAVVMQHLLLVRATMVRNRTQQPITTCVEKETNNDIQNVWCSEALTLTLDLSFGPFQQKIVPKINKRSSENHFQIDYLFDLFFRSFSGGRWTSKPCVPSNTYIEQLSFGNEFGKILVPSWFPKSIQNPHREVLGQL